MTSTLTPAKSATVALMPSEDVREVLSTIAHLQESSVWIASQDVADWCDWPLAYTEAVISDAITMGLLRPLRPGSPRHTNLTAAGARLA